nr:histidine kinase [Actinomycetales bacterium]
MTSPYGPPGYGEPGYGAPAQGGHAAAPGRSPTSAPARAPRSSSAPSSRGSPPWLARAGQVTVDILVLVAALFTALFAYMTAQQRIEAAVTAGTAGALAQVWVGIGIAVGLLAPFLLFARRRTPVVAWVLGAFQMVLPTGPLMMYALPAFLRRCTPRHAIGASALHVIGTTVLFAIDTRGTDGNTSAVRLLTGSYDGEIHLPAPLNLPIVVGLYLLTVLVPVIIGLVGRYRDQLAESRRTLQSSQEDLAEKGASLGRMEEALTRRDEREMIAREIHDVIGHRLSMINVYAGGLELAAADDPELAERARLVREESQATVDDLRSLVRVMRDPQGFTSTRMPGPASLTEVVGMIEEVVGAGRPLASSVVLEHAETAPPVLTHAVYRILQ